MFLFVVFCKVGALERIAIDFRSNIFSLTSKLNESINHLTKNPEKKGLKARIHCEIFFSDYFIKNRLTHISLHIIGFHEIHVKYVKANPSRTIMLFFPDYFTRDENERNSFSKEFSCFSTINEFRTGTLCRILNYSTEHLKVPGNYR